MQSEKPISSREFTREMGNVQAALGRIEMHLERLNGKTATNTEDIKVLKRDVQAIVDEDTEIERKLDQLESEGCAQYAVHTRMLEQLGGIQVWSSQKKAAVIGTLMGSGALMWPALQRIADAIVAVVQNAPGK